MLQVQAFYKYSFIFHWLLTWQQAERCGTVLSQTVGARDEVGHGHQNRPQRGDDDSNAHHASLMPPGTQVTDDQPQNGCWHIIRAGDEAHSGTGEVEATLDGRGVDVVYAIHHKPWLK